MSGSSVSHALLGLSKLGPVALARRRGYHGHESRSGTPLSLRMSLHEQPSAGETVERPEPGLARGRWEAPAWFFYAVLAATVLGSIAWAFRLRARRKR
jgi:hypothetical protein